MLLFCSEKNFLPVSWLQIYATLCAYFLCQIGAELLSLAGRQDLIACQSKQFSHAHEKPYNNILSLEMSTLASIWATWFPLM